MINRYIIPVILFLSWTVTATLQYDRLKPSEGTGFVLRENSRLTIAFIRPDGSPADFANFFPAGLNHFGYYILDNTGQAKATVPLDLISLDRGRLKLGQFTTGDRIAFWASGDNGTYIDSLHHQPLDSERNAYYANDNQLSSLIITMGNVAKTDKNPEGNIAKINDRTNFIFTITSEPPNQTQNVTAQIIGQPLPGALVAFFCGLATTYVLTRLKKNKKNPPL